MWGKLYYTLFRNLYSINKEKSIKNIVNLEYWKECVNIGDTLAPIIFAWMLKQHNISPEQRIRGIKHLLTVGSVIDPKRGSCDATLWGSGIHTLSVAVNNVKYRNIRKLDIRAVRGPFTEKILKSCGYKCPEIYGDPAILMPLIYMPNRRERKNGVIVVRHFKSADLDIPESCRKLDTRTNDYKYFIDELCTSEKVISSSLHGIILSESYGIPAIFLQENMDNEILKFYDWYYSTGRREIKFAYSLDEAIQMKPMPVPDLDEMRKRLLNAFPYDLWEK